MKERNFFFFFFCVNWSGVRARAYYKTYSVTLRVVYSIFICCVVLFSFVQRTKRKKSKKKRAKAAAAKATAELIYTNDGNDDISYNKCERVKSKLKKICFYIFFRFYFVVWNDISSENQHIIAYIDSFRCLVLVSLLNFSFNLHWIHTPSFTSFFSQ